MPSFTNIEKPLKLQSFFEHHPEDHISKFAGVWSELQDYLNTTNVVIDGQTLSLAAMVAVSNHNTTSQLADDPATLKRVEESFQYLMSAIDNGKIIYGVNTGFGGSAGLRTNDTEKLQVALMQLLNVGILSPSDKGIRSGRNSDPALASMRSNALPEQIVRGMMLVRCNSLMRGHSGVTMDVIQGIHKLLENNATPIVPLRGSISASGDLMPLSYIASTLTGNPDVYVRIRSGGEETILTADKALKHLGMEPVKLKAKCGLAIANGTGTSAAAASLALFQSHQLAIWTQVLSAMMSEATVGATSNFASFISEARPHPGQLEVSRNLTNFLKKSQLTMENIKLKRALAQDRYALRTAPQWIGPVLERLNLAHQQVEVELNSTTDNPLIDVKAQQIYNGGNFQAASVTSAMELASSSMQNLGRIVYAQCSEILSHDLNPDLPPNLSADDPSRSLPMKGLDISMSAYMAELAQLTHPVSSHVQSAEMHNQAVNSMALVAARIALDSVDVLYLMVSTYIYVLCQALDLRCLQIEHRVATRPLVEDLARRHFGSYLPIEKIPAVSSEIWQAIEAKWVALSDKDLDYRCTLAVADAAGQVLDILDRNTVFGNGVPGDAVRLFRGEVASILQSQYEASRTRFFTAPPTASYLGDTSKAIYQFVREELKIPMHRGLADHPTITTWRPRPMRKRGRLEAAQAKSTLLSAKESSLTRSLVPYIHRVPRWPSI